MHLFDYCLAEVSFAQSRIFLDEQIRFHSGDETAMAIYNLPLLCRLSECSLSIKRLRETLRLITEENAIFRTCLRFDTVSGNLSQSVQPNHVQDWFGFEVSVISDDKELETILNDEMINRKYFDLSEGRVFRCHVARRRSSASIDDDFLSVGDWIIFNFHHVAFDGESERIFLRNLQELYTHKHQLHVDDVQTKLQYIDCE